MYKVNSLYLYSWLCMLLCVSYSTVHCLCTWLYNNIDSVIIINISTVLNLRQENFSMKSKCKCGDVFGFKIIEALRLIGELEREQALRRFVTSTKRGCAGRLTFPGTGQVSGCIHIQRMQLPESILESLDKGTIIDLYTYNAQSITSKKMQY